MTMKERAKSLKTDIPALFLALRRKDTPLAAKLVAGLAVAYALSPIDLIPDFIPVLGYLDDILLLPGMIAIAIKLIPDDILQECRLQAKALWENGRPKKWYLGLPIVLIYLLLIYLIIKLIWF